MLTFIALNSRFSLFMDSQLLLYNNTTGSKYTIVQLADKDYYIFLHAHVVTPILIGCHGVICD